MKQRLFTAVKRRNKSVYISIYSYTIPAFGPKNPEFPGFFVSNMDFFNSAVTTMSTLVTALGGGLGVWGVINLMEGYGSDNPAAKSQGVKQFMAN